MQCIVIRREISGWGYSTRSELCALPRQPRCSRHSRSLGQANRPLKGKSSWKNGRPRWRCRPHFLQSACAGPVCTYAGVPPAVRRPPVVKMMARTCAGSQFNLLGGTGYYLGLNSDSGTLCAMTRCRHLVWFLAAALFAVVFAMPGVAFAHAGHAHDVPAATQPHAVPSEAAPAVDQATTNGREELHATSHASAARDKTPNERGCTGGCCGTAGMTCCSAIIPSDAATPDLQRSTSYPAGESRPFAGLTPEALPKPPKSLA